MNASINVGISTANKFIEYLGQSNQADTAINKIKYVEEYYKPRNILTLQEINSLYEATYYKSHNNREGTKAIHKAVSQRDRAMLGIYYGCGLRKSEGTSLKTTDILIRTQTDLCKKRQRL